MNRAICLITAVGVTIENIAQMLHHANFET